MWFKSVSAGLEASWAFFKWGIADSCSIPCHHLVEKMCTVEKCHDCDKRFDDLTDTIFAGHHQPLKVWVLCLYFMGLNLSNEQIAHELSINESDAYQMTTELRGGIVKKARGNTIHSVAVRLTKASWWYPWPREEGHHGDHQAVGA
jgi:hypothetical protein